MIDLNITIRAEINIHRRKKEMSKKQEKTLAEL
jgi:hypothetical protein